MRNALLTLAIAIALLAFPGASAQNSSCKVDALVTVVNRNSGLPIDGLTTKDFEAEVQRHESAVHSVAQASPRGRLVFVIDRSGSLVENRIDHPLTNYDPAHLCGLMLDNAFEAIPKNDSVALLAFAGAFSKQYPFSDPLTAAVNMHAMLKWTPTGKGNKIRTALWDNIDAALAMLGTPQEGDAIVVVSDGGDNMSRLSEGELRSKLEAAGVPVVAMTISADPFAATPVARLGPGELSELAKETGGYADVLGPAISRPDPDVVLPVHPSELVRLLAHRYRLNLDIPVQSKPQKWHLELAPSDRSRAALILYPRVLPACPGTATARSE